MNPDTTTRVHTNIGLLVALVEQFPALDLNCVTVWPDQLDVYCADVRQARHVAALLALPLELVDVRGDGGASQYHVWRRWHEGRAIKLWATTPPTVPFVGAAPWVGAGS